MVDVTRHYTIRQQMQLFTAVNNISLEDTYAVTMGKILTFSHKM